MFATTTEGAESSAATIPVEEMDGWIREQFESPEGQLAVREANRRSEEVEFAWVAVEGQRERLRAEMRRCRQEVGRRSLDDPEWPLYFVAMSALLWVGNPEMFASPMKAIRGGEVRRRVESKAAVSDKASLRD